MRRAAFRTAAAAALSLASGGCALPIQAEMDGVSRAARYATRYDHAVGPQANIIDRALAGCGAKTAAAEAACLREAIAGAHIGAGALAALVPGCRTGRICTYDQTTRDRLGLVEVNATDYVKRWRVTLDLRKPTADAAALPVAVADRDDFDATPPAPH